MDNKKLNASIGDKYKKDGTEVFEWKKFRQGEFNLLNPILWIKDIVSLFNLRKIIIFLLIAGTVYGYGIYKGKQGLPIKFNLDYEKEFSLKINDHFLHKPKNSQNLEIIDSKGKKIKTICVKDLPELQRRLKPVGLMLQPIFVAGGSLGKDGLETEMGAGISWVKYYRMRLDSFLTQKGVYLGTSYNITLNSGCGGAIGKGYEGDSRVLFYYKWRF